MILIAFRSMLTPEAKAEGNEYEKLTDVMFARASSWPGFVAMKSYTGEDGERLTLVWWKDAETLRSWREDAPHDSAQRKGRELWYEWYEMDVAEIVRESRFTRSGARERFGPAS